MSRVTERIRRRVRHRAGDRCEYCLVTKRPRTPGSAKGMISMSDDFTAPLDPDIAEEFYS